MKSTVTTTGMRVQLGIASLCCLSLLLCSCAQEFVHYDKSAAIDQDHDISVGLLTESLPGTVAANAAFEFDVSIINNGKYSWTADDGHFYLKLIWHAENTDELHEQQRIAIPLPFSVNEVFSTTVALKAPGKPGEYRLEFSLFQENPDTGNHVYPVRPRQSPEVKVIG